MISDYEESDSEDWGEDEDGSGGGVVLEDEVSNYTCTV